MVNALLHHIFNRGLPSCNLLVGHICEITWIKPHIIKCYFTGIGIIVWLAQYHGSHPGPVFTKRMDVLPLDLVKSRSSENRM